MQETSQMLGFFFTRHFFFANVWPNPDRYILKWQIDWCFEFNINVDSLAHISAIWNEWRFITFSLFLNFHWQRASEHIINLLQMTKNGHNSNERFNGYMYKAHRFNWMLDKGPSSGLRNISFYKSAAPNQFQWQHIF